MRISFAKAHPELIPEWSDKNMLTPQKVSFGSNQMVWWIGACEHEWQASPKARSNGAGCPYCSGKRVLQGVNDLATIDSHLVDEWDTEKNDISPVEVTAGSSKVVWWKDKYGHTWQASIKNRVNGSGCPYCSGNKVLRGFNDLATLYPEIAAEWSEKNLSIRPTEVLPFSNKKVWWKCKKGHEWKTLISDRTRGSGCPYCGSNHFLSGYNDIASVSPGLILDWSVRNGKLQPEDISAKSRECVWWLCHECGYEWRAVIKSRVNGLGCPECRRYEREQQKRMEKKEQKLIRELAKDLPQKLLERMLDERGIKYIKNSMEQIGMILEYYLPEYRVAIEFSKKADVSEFGRRRLLVKSELCKKSEIVLIRFEQPQLNELEYIKVDFNDCSVNSLSENVLYVLDVIVHKT